MQPATSETETLSLEGGHIPYSSNTGVSKHPCQQIIKIGHFLKQFTRPSHLVPSGWKLLQASRSGDSFAGSSSASISNNLWKVVFYSSTGRDLINYLEIKSSTAPCLFLETPICQASMNVVPSFLRY